VPVRRRRFSAQGGIRSARRVDARAVRRPRRSDARDWMAAPRHAAARRPPAARRDRTIRGVDRRLARRGSLRDADEERTKRSASSTRRRPRPAFRRSARASTRCPRSSRTAAPGCSSNRATYGRSRRRSTR
jgi:hypothetical protein